MNTVNSYAPNVSSRHDTICNFCLMFLYIYQFNMEDVNMQKYINIARREKLTKGSQGKCLSDKVEMKEMKRVCF